MELETANPVPDEKPNPRTWVKPAAAILAVIAHLVVLRLMMVSSHTGANSLNLAGMADQTPHGIPVDMMPSQRVSQVTPSKPDNPFDRLMTETNKTPPSKPSSSSEWPSLTQALSQVLSDDPFEPKPEKSTPSPPPTIGELTATQTQAQKAARITVANKDTETPNDLWKAIAPCWKRNATRDSIGVTLQVSFSPLGNLAKPPQIKREAGMALNDQRLRSESQAIMALSQCGPYLMAFGQSDVVINFPAGGKGG